MPSRAVLSQTFTGNQGAPVILYLHGFLGCREDWDEIIKLLGDDFSHLRLDLPGHRMSLSAIPAECYPMPRCAELVIDVLDRRHLDKCHLLGYSMGGRLGLNLLTNYPERFSTAVIESASPGLRTEAERIARRRQDQQVLDRLEKQPFDEFLQEWYSQPLFRTMSKSGPRFAALLERRRQHDPAALALSLKQMGTGAQPPLWNQLMQVNNAVLFIAGDKDAKFQALANRMAGLCPAGQTAIIPGAGHNVHFERPEEFCSEVRRFLSRDE